MRRFLFCGLVLLASASLFAQTVTGTLSGRVTDTTGAVIPGVQVVATSEQTGQVREAVSNQEGYYLISFLNLGSYKVAVKQQGFQPVQKNGVEVELNKTTVSDFVLKVSNVTEVVQVTGETPMVETTIGDVKHGLDAKTIEDSPLAGRNFISLVEQIPGFQNAQWIDSSNNPTNSTGSYAAFAGTGSRSTTFQIDGVNNDDSSENQNRQGVNISSIREFQVLLNAFSAEFGRSAGAVILVQTKSGTNQYHGSGYDFIQNDAFNANGFFQNAGRTPRTVIRRHQYGWTVGGPIKKDKLFFFHSGERVFSQGKGTMVRMIWLPTDGPRACAAGELPRPGGPYCVDPATHPNLQRDLNFMKSVMDLWKTPQLSGKEPNDPVACAQMISTGRPNRCVRVGGLRSSFPDSDYSLKLDWNAPRNTNIALRYQYSRQQRYSPRIILGDNFGTNNNRQYNIGLTATHVFSARQTGEFRFGFGNRSTLQDVTDGNTIPTIRFASVLYDTALTSDTLQFAGTIIGTSTNVPINRRQHDTQFVYNHTWTHSRHNWKFGIDQRFLLLDDLSGDRARGFWTFSTQDATASILARTGYAGWENFLRGFVTGFQQGYGNPLAENRYQETNLYFQEDWRVRPNLTVNLGVRWEGVGAPREEKNRFSYGFGGDYNNFQPRFGFAYQPSFSSGLLGKITGGPGNFVIRGGYGIKHGRIFQSVFSQNQLSIRTQPPNGYAASFGLICPNEISDPSCGFTFTPGVAARSTAATGGGVRVAGGQLQSTLLIPVSNLQVPYTQDWNLSLSRQLPGRMAVELIYTGNRTIGGMWFDGQNDARYPILSPLVTVDVGGGNFQPVVYDRICRDYNDPICVVRDAAGNVTTTTSGALRTFSALASTTATLAQKGIVIEGNVPHGYISLNTPRTNERRPDPNFIRNVGLRNNSWAYYQAATLKFTKRMSHGLSFMGMWTLSKTIDTGSEATFTGVDTNAPTGKGNAAGSLRGLSSYDARHRVVLNYTYELPFFRDSTKRVLYSLLGGWQVNGISTLQSGNPFTVVAGYDLNLDGVGGDRPLIADLSKLYTSVDNGRAFTSCPTTGITGPCPDTQSQAQLPGSAFIPAQVANTSAVGGLIYVTPGADGTGSIGRNTFFQQGMNNTDLSFAKSFQIREGMKLHLRMEWYNLANRVMFGTPARTLLSTVPLGRITTQRNPTGYVNSARNVGSRAGQLALRLTF